MTRVEKAETIYNETKEAITIIYNSLNGGQKNKIKKDDKVAELLNRYEIK